jgi:hypothetical protein
MVTDESAVADAELIVVASIIPDSIQKIAHKRGEHEGASWHHRAKIRIVETLKGHTSSETIEIIIHYGLDPVTGRCLSTKYSFDSDGRPQALGDTKVIGIWDTGGLSVPISEDVRQPHIWLLTRKDFGYTTPDDNDVVGIREPKHLQPICRKEALKNLVLKEPSHHKATTNSKR